MMKYFFEQPMEALKFIVVIILLNMALYHLPLYAYTVKHIDILSMHGILTFLSVLISLFIVSLLILSIFAIISIRVLKIFSIMMFLGNAIALYFVLTYHVILDKTMMGNVFNTNSAETLSYFHPNIVIYLLLLGVLPALFIAKIQIKKVKKVRFTAQIAIMIIVGILGMYLNASTWLWLDKNAKRLGGMSMPWSYMINAIRYKAKELKDKQQQILLPDATFKNDDKMLVVLVIGESARVNNFSLYGYSRETNPSLKKIKNLTVLKAKSTATYTTASVHSMLSYTGSDSDAYEPLPNYLQREGVDVIWRKNNWGEPKLHVKTLESAETLRKSCKGEGCSHDEVLLTNLDEEIVKSKSHKLFVVLHTNGSHGPTYYKKYTKKFEIFKPVCHTVNLKECTNQTLINAYDNTILYTDYFLAKTISLLKKIEDRPILLMYISDHGESLGEYGLYLHGAPYAIAPDVQKQIPFILWSSKRFLEKKRLKVKRDTIYTQNNIFHTVMGAFDMKSTIYKKKFDLLQTK